MARSWPESRPTDRLRALNALPADEAAERFASCCGASNWVKAMVDARPFADEAALLDRAAAAWNRLAPADWLEAFRAHPRIGSRAADGPSTMRAERWSTGEQAGVQHDSDRDALRLANDLYERRFGWIFIVCATGKSGHEMWEQLRARLANTPDAELRIAAREQQAITALRLQKLLNEHD